jgi:hypothetical protein
MLKKTIKYKDFDGNEREEDFYFNLTKAEVVKMQLSHNGGVSKLLERIVAEKDNAKLIEKFQEMIHKSYGVKSDDGKRFVKNEEILNDFMATEAYSELFIELATNTEAATHFINNVMPKEIKEINAHPALNK